MRHKVQKSLVSVGDEIKQYIFENNLARHYNLQLIKRNWEEIVGKNIAKHAYPNKIINNTIYIDVDQPVWSVQLNAMREDVMNAINKYLRDEKIEKIFFKNTGIINNGLKKQKNELTREKKFDISSVSPEKLAEVEKQLEFIGSKELKDELRNLLASIIYDEQQEKETQLSFENENMRRKNYGKKRK